MVHLVAFIDPSFEHRHPIRMTVAKITPGSSVYVRFENLISVSVSGDWPVLLPAPSTSMARGGSRTPLRRGACRPPAHHLPPRRSLSSHSYLHSLPITARIPLLATHHSTPVVPLIVNLCIKLFPCFLCYIRFVGVGVLYIDDFSEICSVSLGQRQGWFRLADGSVIPPVSIFRDERCS